MTSPEIAKYLIKNNNHLVLSTANAESKPWVSPVFYVYDKDFNFYWVSSKDAVHSQNIRVNNQVAIVIFGMVPSGAMDGVYVDAEAIELSEISEIEAAIEVLSLRAQPNKFTTNSPSDVTGGAAWRIYKTQPKVFYKRADATDESSAQAVTVREKISLV